EECLQPLFADAQGLDTAPKRFAFLLGILYGHLIYVQGRKAGVNVAANALCWLRGGRLRAAGLPELHGKGTAKSLDYHALRQGQEFLCLYDIRMSNPNGDPDENRPRRLPDGTFYVSDVRLKRFARDWLKAQGEAILVDRPEDAATNLTGRLQHFLRDKPEGLR